MAGKSVGTLNAMLALSTRDWDAGLSKARKNLERTRAQIIKSMDISGEFLGSKQAEMFATFGGGGMSGMRAARDLSMRRARESYQGRGTAEQQGWQNSMTVVARGARDAKGGLDGMLGTAIKLGGATMAVTTALRASVGLAKAFEGDMEGALDAMKQIPIIGSAIAAGMEAWDYGKAKDLTDAQKNTQKEEAKMRADQARKQSDAVKSWRDEAAKLGARAAIGGLEGVDKDLAEIELARREAVEGVMRDYGEFVGLKSKDMAKARDEAIAAINAKASVDAGVAQREDWKKRSEELAKQQEKEDKAAEERLKDEKEWARKGAEVDAQTKAVRLRMSGRQEDAERALLAQSWAEKIDEARQGGKEELAVRMEQLRNLEMSELRYRGRRMADMDYSSQAGTGATEKVRDVLESIDRGIKRGVVARAA